MEKEDDINKPSRQQLAIDRTHLANERTFLAYVRTSLAIVGLGFLILRFDTSKYASKYGWGIIAFAAIVSVWGTVRFYHFQKRISNEKFVIEHK